MIVQEGRKRFLEDRTKVCCTCKQKLPLDKFYGNSRLAYGKDRVCKTCSGERNKNYKRNVKILKDI